MYKHFYWDKSKPVWTDGHWTYPLVFECIAINILEADKLFKSSQNCEAQKLPYIGCSFEKVITVLTGQEWEGSSEYDG